MIDASKGRSSSGRDRCKTPSQVWMCPTCGKRGTVRGVRAENGMPGGRVTWLGSHYERLSYHCWDRPYDN